MQAFPGGFGVKTWFSPALAAALMLFLAACQGGVREMTDPTLDPANSARLVLYRTNAHVYATESPLFYLDNTNLGSLGRGDAIIQTVAAGTHAITVRRSVLFMPSQTMSTTVVHFKPGETYYLRFGYAMSDTAGAFVLSNGGLAEADETAFNERR